MKKNKTLAIIPARSGSKRIPNKNIKNFLGKPIISYSIKTAIKSKIFKDIVVSTDCEIISSIAEKYGASVPFYRSKKNSSDFATTIDVIKEVVYKLEKRNLYYDYICCLYPTSPLTTIKHLKQGYDKIKNTNLDTIFPVVLYPHPIWRGLTRELGKTKILWEKYLDCRTQDLDSVYHDAGQWYWINRKNISDKLWSNNTHSIVLDANFVQDIDTLSDWELAETKYKLLFNEDNSI